MSLTKEAAYLYLLSKQLGLLNKKIKKLGRKAEKHKIKHEKNRKEKHRVKHGRAVKEIKELLKKHKTVLERLRIHHQRYAYYLRKEHNV